MNWITKSNKSNSTNSMHLIDSKRKWTWKLGFLEAVCTETNYLENKIFGGNSFGSYIK